jgi:hypothetical protein
MNRKSRYFIVFFVILLCAGTLQVICLHFDHQAQNLDDRNQFVKVTGLPDLAISTESMYLRHRSLSSTFAVFKDDPLLLEYFPSTFTYKHTPLLSNTPSVIHLP